MPAPHFSEPKAGSQLRDLSAKCRCASKTGLVSPRVLARNLEAEGYFLALPLGNSRWALKAKAAATKSTISSESAGKNKSVLCERQLSHLSSATGGKGCLLLYLMLYWYNCKWRVNHTLQGWASTAWLRAVTQKPCSSSQTQICVFTHCVCARGALPLPTASLSTNESLRRGNQRPE